MNTHSDKIKEAHNTGRLFVHMFEHGLFNGKIEEGHLCKTAADFFAVLAGTPGAVLDSHWRKTKSTPCGLQGLSTTALHADYPISIWNEGHNIGLLLDGNNREYFRPFWVSSQDAYSMVKDGKLAFNHEGKTEDQFVQLRRMQMPKWCWDTDLLDMNRDTNLQESKAQAALDTMWRLIAQKGWEGYVSGQTQGKPGLNEIIATAHMKAVCGIVVYNRIVPECINPTSLRSEYVRDVKEAKQLREYLMQSYGAMLPADLKIFSYNPNRVTNKLIELSPDQLLNPGRFYDEMHPQAGAKDPHPRIMPVGANGGVGGP